MYQVNLLPFDKVAPRLQNGSSIAERSVGVLSDSSQDPNVATADKAVVAFHVISQRGNHFEKTARLLFRVIQTYSVSCDSQAGDISSHM